MKLKKLRKLNILFLLFIMVILSSCGGLKPRYGAGVSLKQKKEAREKIAQLDVKLLKDPLNPKYLVQRASLNYSILSKPEEAEKDLETVLEHDPEYIDAYYTKAMLEMSLGNEEESEKAYTKMIEIAPDNHMSYLAKALALLIKADRLGFSNEKVDIVGTALDAFDMALEKKPDLYSLYALKDSIIERIYWYERTKRIENMKTALKNLPDTEKYKAERDKYARLLPVLEKAEKEERERDMEADKKTKEQYSEKTAEALRTIIYHESASNEKKMEAFRYLQTVFEFTPDRDYRKMDFQEYSFRVASITVITKGDRFLAASVCPPYMRCEENRDWFDTEVMRVKKYDEKTIKALKSQIDSVKNVSSYEIHQEWSENTSLSVEERRDKAHKQIETAKNEREKKLLEIYNKLLQYDYPALLSVGYSPRERKLDGMHFEFRKLKIRGSRDAEGMLTGLWNEKEPENEK